MASLDLRYAYYSIPIHNCHQKFLRVAVPFSVLCPSVWYFTSPKGVYEKCYRDDGQITGVSGQSSLA